MFALLQACYDRAAPKACSLDLIEISSCMCAFWRPVPLECDTTSAWFTHSQTRRLKLSPCPLSFTGSLEASRPRASTEQRPCVWRAPWARQPPSSASSTSAAATTHRSSLTDAATRCGFYRRSRRRSDRENLMLKSLSIITLSPLTIL